MCNYGKCEFWCSQLCLNRLESTLTIVLLFYSCLKLHLMGKNSNSSVGLDIEDSTVHNQTSRKLSDQSQNDMNSSLIFGNEITSKSSQTQNDDVQEKPFSFDNELNDNRNHKQNLIKEAPTQNDNTFELLQNPNDTPFLAKLKDPFDETYNESLQNLSIETPLNKKNSHQLNDTVPLQSKPIHKYNFETLRNEADNSCLEYETQGNETILGNDTNQIPNEADTQIVNNLSGSDTLRFAANSNRFIKSNEFIFNEETQVDSNKHKSYIENDTQIIDPRMNDTQVIAPPQDDYNTGTTKIDANEDNLTSSSPQNSMQIPSTVEKPFFSRPQVINTQEEEPDSTPSNTKVDLSTRPVYSSSQRLGEEEEEEEEVRTDDEKDKDKLDQHGIYYEDSLLAHQLKNKRRLSNPEINCIRRKAIRVSPNKDIHGIMDKQIPVNNMSKTPLSFKNKHHHQVAVSPSEIDESSPGIKRTDILGFPNKSSPQTDNDPSNTNNNNSETNKIKSQSNLPSSPTKERARIEMAMKFPGIQNTELKDVTAANEINSDSSELEDIDLVHFNGTNSIPTITRKSFTVDTSSQSHDDLHPNKDQDSSQISTMDVRMNDLQGERRKIDTVLFEEVLNVLTQNDIRSMQSVWVSFKFNMYTGKTTKVGHDNLIVEFEEGSYSIKNSDLYLLDIRIGDKLRIRSSKYKFVVIGLTYNKNGDDIKCIRGYNIVCLRRISKVKRKEFEELEANLSECYMELSDWIQHQQTFQFLFDGQDLLKHDGGNIFLNNLSFDIHRTPSRNTRYSNTPDVIEYDLKYRSGPLSSPSKKNESRIVNGGTLTKLGAGGIFSGMLFCLTFGKSVDEDKKEKIKDAIENNGGSLLEGGLHDILKYSSSQNRSLELKSPVLSAFSFGAVISNNFCRSAKYLQALALGWPILSDYYIFDCLKDNKKLNNWPVYLLPAGQSQYLGTIKSLEIFKFRQNYESKKDLSYQLNNNNHLLQDAFIIIINNKANLKTLQTCEFIFHAFGAKYLKYCSSTNEIANITKQCKDDLILVYDNNETIKQDMKALKVENTGGTRTRSQSRASTKQNSDIKNSIPKKENIGFINWEWVVQCVISGHIWDPEYI